MMTSTQLKEAHELAAQIRATKSLIVQYGEGGDVTVSLSKDRGTFYGNAKAQVTLPHSEIGVAIVSALEARAEAMIVKLRASGIEWVDKDSPQGPQLVVMTC